jgi:DNA-binding transcriptional ArsR family regulator
VRIKKRSPDAIRVLSNPIAYRILAAVGMRGPQTTADVARALPDVPPSSLYRQLTRLRTAGLLQVSGERQARGAVERTYALPSRDAAAFAPKDLAAAPIAQLRATLRNFVATMAANVSAYIESKTFARNRLRMMAGLIVAKLTDDDYVELMREVNGAIARLRTSSRGRPSAKRRYFYIVALPEDPTQ